MKLSPKIIFMGTPEFSLPSLAGLIEEGYPIVGVVTQPDRPKGRGKALAPTPVKTLAQEKGLPVYQPERVRNAEFLEIFHALAPEMVVLVAFGQILPKEIIESPKFGCINVHPSLLPKYRGAAPMNWTLINGETRTGVTIMLMNEGVDSGDILLQEETAIMPDETFDSLHDRLARLGADMLIKTIEMMLAGTVHPSAQNNFQATFAPRLKKEDASIDWNRDATAVVNRIRGLSSQPGAYTVLDGKKFKILKASAEETGAGNAGQVGELTQKGLPVAAKTGVVYVHEVQLEGKKRMSVSEFLRGCRIVPGTVLKKNFN